MKSPPSSALKSKAKQEISLLPSAGFLLDPFFDLEDGGNLFLKHLLAPN
jgi:hypothetical protein